MISHSAAFATYRNLSQEHIDFVVIVCHAIPALEADIALANEKLTYKPYHFKQDRNPKSWVAEKSSKFEPELARSTLITTFSYFEAYIKDALTEIVNFHGGTSKLRTLARDRSSQFIRHESQSVKADKRKLQDNPSPAKREKYQKYARKLDKLGYRFPTDILSSYGAHQLTRKLYEEKNGLKAWEIPTILEECLLFEMKPEEKDLYEKIRVLRNKISHGRKQNIQLTLALRYASELHTLAAKVDAHIANHFFVIQEM